jgi:N-acetylmuramoyl-L-alanine amidase
MPAVLIEHSFVDNVQDMQIIGDPMYLGAIGLACALGVEDYFK